MLGAEAAVPKRVLILHSFGRDFEPYGSIAPAFRASLARGSSDTILFYEATFDAGRKTSPQEERTFVEYLGARFGGNAPDLIVTLGPPAAQFYLAHRDELFPETPLLVSAINERFVRGAPLRRNDAAVVTSVDLALQIEAVLRVLPETTTIAVVLGTSELERFWRAEFQKAVAPLGDRIRFLYLDDLSVEQMRERVASLPPQSAIFLPLLIVDAAGVPHDLQDALTSLRAAANAPIFGLYETALGKGIVGGPYLSQRRNGELAAAAALRLLSGATSTAPQVETVAFESPVYDWRELQRWNIDRSRLPPGSEVRFKPPSMWEEHRVAVVATMAALALQAALITALIAQRARRRRAEHEAEGLAGRLVTAHEDERRRLARELHDDVTQRLAGLAIEAAELESGEKGTVKGESAHAIREGLVELGEDVHALSYRLHPSVIEDLGLVEALRIECDRVAQQGPLRVSFDCRDMPKRLPADAALCLFRVAQEAMRNVERHAQANNVDVSIVGKDGGIALAVRDNGTGFDPLRTAKRASLGLASMRERVRILGGRIHIESGHGRGTAVSAWLPLHA